MSFLESHFKMRREIWRKKGFQEKALKIHPWA